MAAEIQKRVVRAALSASVAPQPVLCSLKEAPDRQNHNTTLLGQTRPKHVSTLCQMTAEGTWLTAGAAVLDTRGQIIEANDEFALWAGSHPGEGAALSEVLGRKCSSWQLIAEELLLDDAAFRQTHLEDTTCDPPHWYHLSLVRQKEGMVLHLNRCLPPAGQMAETSWNDYTEGRSTRELYARLLRAEGQLRMLSGRWPGVLFSQRPDFTFSFVSKRIEDWTGIPVEDWGRTPQRFWDIVHEADAADLQKEFARWRGRGSLTTTYRIRHARTGRVTYIFERRDAITTANGLVLGYDGAWVDVTRQTIAEKRLASAVWKETLGVLTMGLAHDFSNIMAGIYSLSETYHSMTEPGHPFQEGFSLIQRNAMQATQLVQRILNLHLGKVGQRNYHNISELVSDTLEIVRKTVRRVKLHADFAADQLALYLDPVEFRQVLVNLILNAADAMPDGGEIFFKTALHKELPPLGTMQGIAPRLPAVCVSVRDTGSGIPPEHQPHIFDPFFTTKPLNKGSGLGLYNARLFVEKHGGAISVESKENEGTTFSIWLPLADFSEAERLNGRANRQRKTLLLLEPSGKMLESSARCLRESGFYVATASSEPAAVELLHSPDYQFDAVMAVVNGRTRVSSRLFNEISRMNLPVKKVVQISGSNQDDHDSGFLRLADLVIGSDVPAGDIAARLGDLLNPPNS